MYSNFGNFKISSYSWVALFLKHPVKDDLEDIAGLGIARVVRGAQERENWRSRCAAADRLKNPTVWR